MGYSTYILYSQKIDRYYVGHTENITIRLQQHNEGISKYTSKASDWKIVYSVQFNSREEAAAFERSIKKKKSRKFIQMLISSAG